MDNWRTRAFNKLLFRIMRQRMARCETTQEMRELIASIDSYGALFSSPKSLTISPTKFADVSCDWVDMSTSRGNRILLYFHGGGFCFTSPKTHTSFLGRIARGSQSRGLMVNYSLSPEYPYPQAVNEAFAVYNQLLINGYLPDHIFIAGDSAGGNLALTTLVKIRNEGLVMPAGAALLSPVSDMAVTGESAFTKSKDDPFFDLSSLLLMRNNYIGTQNPCNPEVSPFYAELHDLPPIYITVGTEEILMDDSIRLAEKIGQAGGKVTLDVVKGVPHVYPLFNQLSEAEQAVQVISAFIEDCYQKAKLSNQCGNESDNIKFSRVDAQNKKKRTG
ncbi:alpha/beta hydrolase [Photobacterium damselae]|uniref:alpha/beta hydrolase n=1 Tax=Photobacterium damselae TaxID=38293 RepID=UPI00165E2E45|nr:alpha/beta hydrolase [Photobacterium damselae]